MKPTHYDAALAITCLMRAASQQNLYEEPSFESEWNFEDGFACYQVFIRIYKVNSKWILSSNIFYQGVQVIYYTYLLKVLDSKPYCK